MNKGRNIMIQKGGDIGYEKNICSIIGSVYYFSVSITYGD
jgi:hypothetical protein